MQCKYATKTPCMRCVDNHYVKIRKKGFTTLKIHKLTWMHHTKRGRIISSSFPFQQRSRTLLNNIGSLIFGHSMINCHLALWYKFVCPRCPTEATPDLNLWHKIMPSKRACDARPPRGAPRRIIPSTKQLNYRNNPGDWLHFLSVITPGLQLSAKLRDYSRQYLWNWIQELFHSTKRQ